MEKKSEPVDELLDALVWHQPRVIGFSDGKRSTIGGPLCDGRCSDERFRQLKIFLQIGIRVTTRCDVIRIRCVGTAIVHLGVSGGIQRRYPDGSTSTQVTSQGRLSNGVVTGTWSDKFQFGQFQMNLGAGK